MWGNNSVCDGIKVEENHGPRKDFQNNHDNHLQPYKTAVTSNSTTNLLLQYAINGGKWGSHFQYQLGEMCAKLKHPKKPQQPNMAIENFLFVKSIKSKCKVYVSKCWGISKERSQPPVLVAKHGHLNELMQHINSVVRKWNLNRVTWLELLRDSEWTIQSIKSFRFHNHSMSFAITLTDNKKCIMKTNDARICQFKSAYQFKHAIHGDILLAFGCWWNIKRSKNPYNWSNDRFNSMDFLNIKNRHTGWFFMTNLLEPVFIIHECVSFHDVRKTLPRHWRHKQHKDAFYHNFAFNNHQLMLDKDEFSSKKVRQSIQLPCGPVFCCKKHDKCRCYECPVRQQVYKQNVWNLKWKCNTNFNPYFRILDCKNGLSMTLMKTVKCHNIFEY